MWLRVCPTWLDVAFLAVGGDWDPERLDGGVVEEDGPTDR